MSKTVTNKEGFEYNIGPDTELELAGANLAGVDLSGADLYEANLSGANGKLSYQRVITADGIKRVSRSQNGSEIRSRILELRDKTKFSRLKAQRVSNLLVY